MIDSSWMATNATLSSSHHDQTADMELENKVRKSSEKISENLHIFANEPSLACYRLQEHIQKSLPQLVTKKIEVNQIQRDLQGKCYDLEYSIKAVKSMQRSEKSFQTTKDLLLKATGTKQQLALKEPQKVDRKKTAQSMYQRFSGSFDLPSTFLPSGLSSSASANADLKLSQGPINNTQHKTSNSSGQRARASSVSSAPSSEKQRLSRTQSASVSPTPKKMASLGTVALRGGYNIS